MDEKHRNILDWLVNRERYSKETAVELLNSAIALAKAAEDDYERKEGE